MAKEFQYTAHYVRNCEKLYMHFYADSLEAAHDHATHHNGQPGIGLVKVHRAYGIPNDICGRMISEAECR